MDRATPGGDPAIAALARYPAVLQTVIDIAPAHNDGAARQLNPGTWWPVHNARRMRGFCF
jgi:hypothetical protein